MIIARSSTAEALRANGAIYLGTRAQSVASHVISGEINQTDLELMVRMDVYTHTTTISTAEFANYGLETLSPEVKLLDFWYVPRNYTVELPNIYANPRLFTQEFINGIRS